MEANITGRDNKQPLIDRPWDDIFDACEVGGLVKVLSPLEYHTDRQRRWYKGVCLTGLADGGMSKMWWDMELKRHCDGLKLLKKEILLTDNGTPLGRLTLVGVGKKNLTQFIENILDKNTDEPFKAKHNWPYIPPPDAELRKKPLKESCNYRNLTEAQ